MLLAVDVGNTKIKAAVFEDDALLGKFIFDKNDSEKKIEKIFSDYPGLAHSVLSSVGAGHNEVIAILLKNTDVTVINHQSAFPFQNLYETPQTLGIDRMVLSAGASMLYPEKNKLVIDAGTCVTYDFTDSRNRYHGGAISPGLRLRYEAMHNFTAKLPLLYPEIPQDYTGSTTKQSMHSGVVNGLLFEIEGFIARYNQDYGSVAVILTGGDAEFLAVRLKNTIFANSNFLLESLNKLYTIQNKHD
jgi:type III pantothenate kinase